MYSQLIKTLYRLGSEREPHSIAHLILCWAGMVDCSERSPVELSICMANLGICHCLEILEALKNHYQWCSIQTCHRALSVKVFKKSIGGRWEWKKQVQECSESMPSNFVAASNSTSTRSLHLLPQSSQALCTKNSLRGLQSPETSRVIRLGRRWTNCLHSEGFSTSRKA